MDKTCKWKEKQREDKDSSQGDRELSDRLQDTGINRKDTWKQRKVSGEAGKGIKETASTGETRIAYLYERDQRCDPVCSIRGLGKKITTAEWRRHSYRLQERTAPKKRKSKTGQKINN